jgi:CRISPR-associated protein Cas8a1/Csx13
MGEIENISETHNDSSSSMTISLFGPGMTAIHKAGVAGLWMTLRSLERDQHAKQRLLDAGGFWDLSNTEVSLHWKGKGFFKALFQESFKIDKNGLLWFPALGVPTDHPQHSVVLQEALLGSFLQHGRTRKSDSAQTPKGAVTVEIDEIPLILKFHKVTQYANQIAQYDPMSINPVAGWQLPGGAVRHVGLGQHSTALEESPEGALALRYAPVGAIYFEIRRRGGSIRPHYALVFPEIVDLKGYARSRETFLKYGVAQLYASGTAEAGFRVLTELQAAGLSEDLQSSFCRVFSFGTVPWSKQQKTRVDVFTVRAGSQEALRTFTLCRQFFVPRLVRPADADPFWVIPQMPDLIARNLSAGRQWWMGFADFLADEDLRNQVLGYVKDRKSNKVARMVTGEKGGLANMVEDTQALPDGPERIFVQACHQAWRRRLGQLGQRARGENASFGDLANREFERLRVSFSRCKNVASLRAAVTDFWARGGGTLPSIGLR